MPNTICTIAITAGGQTFEVVVKDDDTIQGVLNRNDVPMDGAVVKNGKVAEGGDSVADGDKVAVSPKSGAQG